MKILGVIPARYASSRFEGKPLKDICGHAMIEWVYKRAKNADIDEIVVATDDERIFKAVEKFGGNVVMTAENHQNGTSRIIEVINKSEYENYDFIINIQGDEPLIDIESINILANNYRNEKSEIVTLKQEMKSQNENAIYFSRSVIPYERDKNNSQNIKNFKHVGIYGYTVKFLNELKILKEGVLEKIESLEQLRFIENGYKIKVLETKSQVIGVDTQEDLKEVVKFITDNGITLK